MSNDNTFSTSLEHLPTEIFLQVFGLLPLQEIVTAFSGLNSYIDSVIQSVIGASHVVRYSDAEAINSLHFFPTQIIRLIIVNVEIADFTALINLRSLTLKYGTQEQFNSIRPQYFPMLEILHIKGLHTTMNENTQTISNLFQAIFSNDFPRLRICTTFDVGAVAFSDTWIGSPALHTLNLNMKTKHDCEQFRSVCLHLRRLTTYQTSMGDPPTGKG
ncbi:unnamed protein product [Rotaria sp. Silwood2]|nr:unnamed protein product [Rotaria sp. Silwood2]CAF3931497.1 unnamed protein product [Rotaria sp. Silwood2]CAF4173233.1 unnamed protein product [Rotaria sp. Silwood2]